MALTISENCDLRMASLTTMATNFTAFDHPTCQRVITQHITDVKSMPKELVEYFVNGGFALSILCTPWLSTRATKCLSISRARSNSRSSDILFRTKWQGPTVRECKKG